MQIDNKKLIASHLLNICEFFVDIPFYQYFYGIIGNGHRFLRKKRENMIKEGDDTYAYEHFFRDYT